MIRCVLFAALAVFAPALFFACSGTSATTPALDAGGASSTGDGGGALPGPDGAGDAGNPASEDSSAGDGASAASCAAQDGSLCLSCCAALDPGAYASFTALVRTCACSAEVCGPLEAGAADAGDDAAGDAGAAADDGGFGEGACATECSAATTGSSTPPACESCLRLSLGTTSSPGVCGTVAAQCITITACAPFFECVVGCH